MTLLATFGLPVDCSTTVAWAQPGGIGPAASELMRPVEANSWK
jgi:hypothetical protein